MRPLKLRYTPRTRLDIDGIHNWIAARNPRAATAVVERIAKTAALLADHPGIGRETDIPRLHVLPVVRYPYLLYHSVSDDEVVIVHVRHGARGAPTRGELS